MHLTLHVAEVRDVQGVFFGGKQWLALDHTQ